MRSKSLFSLTMAATLSAATVLSLALPLDAASAQDRESKKRGKKGKEEAPKQEISAEFGNAYNASFAAIEAQNFAEAQSQLLAAEAIAKTADETYFLGNGFIRLGGLTDDKAMQRKGLELAINSGKSPADEVGRFMFFSGRISYDQQNYADAEFRLKGAIDAGYTGNSVDLTYIDTIFRQERTADGLAALREAIARLEARNSTIEERFYRTGVRNASLAGMAEETLYWSQLWVEKYPSPSNWRDTLVLFRGTANYPSSENIDLMRLMRVSDAMASEQDYAEYIESADSRRLPGEVLSVIEEGIAKGNLSTGNGFFTENIALAKDRIPEDRSSLDASVAKAQSSSNPLIAIGTADAYLGYGDYAKASQLYTLALEKPGADKNLVNTRLGISAAMQGNYDAARASFAKVGGAREPLAKFWMIWVDEKAGSTAG